PGRRRLTGRSRRRFAAGDEVDVDAVRAGLLDHPPYDRPAARYVPPAVLDGPDHDLGDLMLPGEADDGPGRVVILDLVPAGAEAARQLPQLVDRPAVAKQAGVAGDDVDHVQFPLH